MSENNFKSMEQALASIGKNKSNPRVNKKIKSEQQTRAAVLNLARESGVEEQAIKLLNKYDSALKNCKTEAERRAIAVQGNAEIHVLLGLQGPLVVDGQMILPGKPGWEEELKKEKGFVKID